MMYVVAESRLDTGCLLMASTVTASDQFRSFLIQRILPMPGKIPNQHVSLFELDRRKITGLGCRLFG